MLSHVFSRALSCVYKCICVPIVKYVLPKIVKFNLKYISFEEWCFHCLLDK